MIKHFLLTAWQVLLKNKMYSLINVLGLAIGLACCLLIALFVREEIGYDQHWTDSERLYRLNTSIDVSGDNPVLFGAAAMPAKACRWR